MQDKKHFGQIAYEGYCQHTDWKSLVSGAPLPPWDNLPDAIKAAWQTAANAAIDAHTERK